MSNERLIIRGSVGHCPACGARDVDGDIERRSDGKDVWFECRDCGWESRHIEWPGALNG